jgi:hypothetical protein
MNADQQEPDRAVWFYQEVVEPTVAEFLGKRDDIRLGCLACIALSSMVEHYFHARRQEFGSQNAQDFRRTLAAYSAFEIVFDVANATKHVVPARNRAMDFKSASRIMELDKDTYKSEQNNDEPKSILGDLELPTGSHVMVLAGNDVDCVLADQVEAVNEMWRTKL